MGLKWPDVLLTPTKQKAADRNYFMLKKAQVCNERRAMNPHSNWIRRGREQAFICVSKIALLGGKQCCISCMLRTTTRNFMNWNFHMTSGTFLSLLSCNIFPHFLGDFVGMIIMKALRFCFVFFLHPYMGWESDIQHLKYCISKQLRDAAGGMLLLISDDSWHDVLFFQSATFYCS